MNKPRIPRPAALRQFSLSRKLPPLKLPLSAAKDVAKPPRFPKPGRSIFYAMTRKKS